jgi:hypothetical protein
MGRFFAYYFRKSSRVSPLSWPHKWELQFDHTEASLSIMWSIRGGKDSNYPFQGKSSVDSLVGGGVHF